MRNHRGIGIGSAALVLTLVAALGGCEIDDSGGASGTLEITPASASLTVENAVPASVAFTTIAHLTDGRTLTRARTAHRSRGSITRSGRLT